MFSERSYTRNDYPDRGRAALPWIISAIAAGFILENIFTQWFNTGAFTQWFALTIGGIGNGHVWQLLTYAFVHPGGQVMYVLVVAFNLLCLYLLGKEMEALLGTKRFVGLYLGAVLLGGLAWLAVNYRFGGLAGGAWPGIAALFVLFACLNADQPVPLLILFVAPVTLKPKYVAWALFAIDFCGLAFWEVRGEPSPLGVNHSAHLGGMLAGYLYFRVVHQREWRHPDGKVDLEPPQWMKKSKNSPAVAANKFKLNLTNREDLRMEVDRILDKINSEGFAALTAEEKRLLDDAKDLLSRP